MQVAEIAAQEAAGWSGDLALQEPSQALQNLYCKFLKGELTHSLCIKIKEFYAWHITLG